MDVAYTNAERLILTELNAVETRASADAMKAADFDYYQFAATLDRRTCPICGERDGEVYPLTAMNQGENAPPMHPRCRCTIVASMEGVGRGQRAASRTRVPADMSYRDWLKSLTPSSKIRAGLSAGGMIDFAEGGKPPRLIGTIEPTAAKINRALEWFEGVAVNAPIENALIITELGEVYHCTGDVNSLNSIVELGNKLEGANVTHNHPAGAEENDNTFSDKDKTFFSEFKLARLRGVDERFVYELNRDAKDNELAGRDLTDVYSMNFDFEDSHVAVMLWALINSFGYWRRPR